MSIAGRKPLIQHKQGMALLEEQLEREASVVAELNGIRMADLGADVKATIKKAIGK